MDLYKLILEIIITAGKSEVLDDFSDHWYTIQSWKLVDESAISVRPDVFCLRAEILWRFNSYGGSNMKIIGGTHSGMVQHSAIRLTLELAAQEKIVASLVLCSLETLKNKSTYLWIGREKNRKVDVEKERIKGIES